MASIERSPDPLEGGWRPRRPPGVVDEDHRHAEIVAEPEDEIKDDLRGRRVDRPGRLVGQRQPRRFAGAARVGRLTISYVTRRYRPT